MYLVSKTQIICLGPDFSESETCAPHFFPPQQSCQPGQAFPPSYHLNNAYWLNMHFLILAIKAWFHFHFGQVLLEPIDQGPE